jgi:hypothetical protein
MGQSSGVGQELLTGFAHCDNVGGVIDDRRPIEPLSEDFCYEGSGADMPPHTLLSEFLLTALCLRPSLSSGEGVP